MNARDELYAALAKGVKHAQLRQHCIDTYRAEVLREAADALEARVADDDVDTKRTWAGMDAAYLRRMADEAVR